MQALKDILALPHPNLYEQSFGMTVNQGILNAGVVNTAISTAPTFTTAFPNSSLGNQLKMIAKLIYGRTTLKQNRQIYFASTGGFDLHSAQIGTTAAPTDPTVGSHANLLADLSKCLKAFYDATAQLGVASNVTAFTVSDFSRTFPVNSGVGSDHGWGNHQIVVGGGVVGQEDLRHLPHPPGQRPRRHQHRPVDPQDQRG